MLCMAFTAIYPTVSLIHIAQADELVQCTHGDCFFIPATHAGVHPMKWHFV
jgi:hypothetical protein